MNPSDQKHPERVTWVKVWREVDYKLFIEGNSNMVRSGAITAEDQRERFRKAMNVDEIEIVHDPSYTIPRPVPEPGVMTAKKIAKPKGGAKR